MAGTSRRTLIGWLTAAALLVPAAGAQAAPLDPQPPTTHQILPINSTYSTCPDAITVVGELDRTVHLFTDASGQVVKEFRNLRFTGQLVGANGMTLPYVGHWRVTLYYEPGGYPAVAQNTTFQGLSRMATLPDGSRLIAAGRTDRDPLGNVIGQAGNNSLTEWEATVCALLAAD